MNCEWVADRISDLVAERLPTGERAQCLGHIAGCPDCSDAYRGASALLELRAQPVEAAPAGLFERVMERAVEGTPRHQAGRGRFWLGTAFGGAIAATLLVAALALGWLVRPPADDSTMAEFYVSREETRPMYLAIEADKPLPGARISVLLSGNVQLDGFGDRRELSWNDDLEAGINKLTLPLIAVGADGGQMVVRLSHPDSEQVFVVRLKLDS